MGLLSDIVRGGAMGATVDMMGAPVDLVSAILKAGGYSHPEPFGGSEWIAKKLGVKQTGSLPEQAARFTSGLLSPTPDIGPAIGLLGAIKAYHGSPHKFDKFSMSNIGTGEGAQAYGHGLYFAENPRVAGQYAVNLARDKRVDLKHFDHDKGYGVDDATAPNGVRWFNSEKEAKEFVREKEMENMYEVSLRWPDATREAKDPLGPQHFLDWDKPLSQQSKMIQDAIEKTGLAFRDSPKAWVEPRGNGKFHVVVDGQVERHLFNTKSEAGQFAKQVALTPNWYWAGRTGKVNTGDQFYREAGGRKQLFDKEAWKQQDKATSDLLRDAGIPGIRYLDGGSRAAGEGTANYVAFDDAIVEILKRNGVPIK